jgi:acyl-CoA thioesterase FadM
MRSHTWTTRIHLWDLNAYGDVHGAAWLRLLWQAASDASAAAGFGLDWYERHGTIWLIRRTALAIPAPARVDDSIAITTWVADIRRVRSRREYDVSRSSDKAAIARAWTDWVYVDARGKPVRVPEQVQHALMPDGVVARERTNHPWPAPPAGAFRRRRCVEFAALDTVAHVNNAYYAHYLEQDVFDALAARGWAIDPAARDGHLRLGALDIEYFDAALYRDEIEGSVWIIDGATDSFTCAHAIGRAGTHLVRARTEWHWSAGAMPAALRGAVASLGQL